MLRCRNVLWPSSVKLNVKSPRKEKTYNRFSIEASLVFLRLLFLPPLCSAEWQRPRRLSLAGHSKRRKRQSVAFGQFGRRASKTTGGVWSGQSTVICEHIALRVVLLSGLSSHNTETLECFSLPPLSPKTPNCFFLRIPRLRRLGYWHHMFLKSLLFSRGIGSRGPANTDCPNENFLALYFI